MIQSYAKVLKFNNGNAFHEEEPSVSANGTQMVCEPSKLRPIPSNIQLHTDGAHRFLLTEFGKVDKNEYLVRVKTLRLVQH